MTIAAVEALLRERRRSLAFPDWLEAKFEGDTRARRFNLLHANIFRLIILYNTFIFADWFIFYDTFYFALALHGLVVTPWMGCTILFLRRGTKKIVRDLTIATLPIAVTGQILCIFTYSHSPYATHYVSFVVMTILFSNNSQLFYFYNAFWTSATIFLMLLLVIAAVHPIPLQIAAVHCMTFACCAFVTLNASYYRERDFRRAYLRTLRDSLTVAEKDTQANHDALTGLANRRFLESRATAVWKDAASDREPVAVILLDVDHFKAFNDRYGHPEGDICLKRVAACAGGELRNSGDLAVRYGGEEFLLLLPGAELAEAREVAERIRRAIAAMAIANEGAGSARVVTASLGVATARTSTTSLLELIAAADGALYAAKRSGRNQVCPSAPPGAGERPPVSRLPSAA